jgi:hypothetical protein
VPVCIKKKYQVAEPLSRACDAFVSLAQSSTGSVYCKSTFDSAMQITKPSNHPSKELAYVYLFRINVDECQLQGLVTSRGLRDDRQVSGEACRALLTRQGMWLQSRARASHSRHGQKITRPSDHAMDFRVMVCCSAAVREAA